MMFDLAAMDPAARYRLLMSTVVPRPIAWLSTMDKQGVVNLAPFSCFNVMGASPSIVAIGISTQPDGREKDSCANIRQTGEMVVNLVARPHLDAMFATAQDHPPEVDEAQLAGIATKPALHVRPPLLHGAPCSLECRTWQFLQPGEGLSVVLAEVLAVHVRDELVLDPKMPRVDTPGLDVVGRMEGPGWYTSCDDRFLHPQQQAGSTMTGTRS